MHDDSYENDDNNDDDNYKNFNDNDDNNDDNINDTNVGIKMTTNVAIGPTGPNGPTGAQWD